MPFTTWNFVINLFLQENKENIIDSDSDYDINDTRSSYELDCDERKQELKEVVYSLGLVSFSKYKSH